MGQNDAIREEIDDATDKLLELGLAAAGGR